MTHGPLYKRRTYRVAGTTSRGAYLQPEDELTIYISSDPFRGPLTVNIQGDAADFPVLQPGDTLTRIGEVGEPCSLRAGDQLIKIYPAPVWHPPQPPAYHKLSRFRSKRVCRQARSILGDHPYLSLLEFASGGSAALLEEHPGFADRVTALARSLGTGELDKIHPGMQLVLGAGPGLTPLGDDLLIGILLTLKRSGKYDTSNSRIREQAGMQLALLDEAREKTTELSHSLLYSACLGSADERIVHVMDRLGSGRVVPDPDLASLLDWGSSSGIGVLAGMLLALSK